MKKYELRALIKRLDNELFEARNEIDRLRKTQSELKFASVTYGDATAPVPYIVIERDGKRYGFGLCELDERYFVRIHRGVA